ncbi:MAG TPA: type II toxin-antitoxin system VapC family toxin [Acidobacteriota bacterium]
MTLYLETSALLAWLLGEPRSREVISRINAAKTVVTSVVTLLEAERVLVRAEAQGILAAADSQKLSGILAKAAKGWMLMELSEQVRRRAAERFPLEPVRTLDAVHLSTALIFTRAFPDLKLFTHDDRIRRNALTLGLQ